MGFLGGVLIVAGVAFAVAAIAGLFVPRWFVDRKTGKVPSRWQVLIGGWLASALMLGLGSALLPKVAPGQDASASAVAAQGNDAARKLQSLTEQDVRALDADISGVELIEQVTNPGTWYVQLTLKQDPYWGGADDWNIVAGKFNGIARTLFDKPEVVRLGMTFVSPANQGVAWANIYMNRKDLPPDWHDLTYLQLFAHADPRPPSLQTIKWLCAFYEKHTSATPPQGVPQRWCSD